MELDVKKSWGDIRDNSCKNCVVLECGSVRWLKVILTVIYPSTQQGGLVKEDGVLFSAEWQF